MARPSRSLAAVAALAGVLLAACSSSKKDGARWTSPYPFLDSLAGTWTSCTRAEGGDVLEIMSFVGTFARASSARFASTDGTCTGPATSVIAPDASLSEGAAVPVTLRLAGSTVTARAIDVTVGDTRTYTILFLDTASSPPRLYKGDDPAPGDPAHDGSAPERRHWILDDEHPFTRQPTYTVSGTVGGAVRSGVLLWITGPVTWNTVTEADGTYRLYFPGYPAGLYTVTPSLPGYTFSPPSATVTLAGANATGVDFTAFAGTPTWTISGTVTGAPGPVTVDLTGPSTATTTTTGAYAFPGLAAGRYTVTPSASGQAFTPPSYVVTIAGADQPGKDFAASAEGPLTPFDAWERLVSALRTSPDHLPARAAALVAQRDAAAIHAFVRDEIVTDPPEASGFASAETKVRWGPRGTLRGGTGTPREKAELLAALYLDAGFVATVVVGRPDPARVNLQAAVLRTVERRFAPVLEPAQVSRWMDALGLTTTVPLQVVDPSGAERAALADTMDALVSPPAGAAFSWSLPYAIPLVRVIVDGQPRFANPLVPGAQLGEALTLATPTLAGRVEPPTVRVRLDGALASAPGDFVKMVERTWSTDEVVGRRVVLEFAPLLDAASLKTTRAGDVSVLVPTLRVESPGLDPQVAATLAAVGDPFTTGGSRIAVDDAGAVTVDGAAIGAGDTAPATLARVASASAEADAGQFPVVRVRVAARDAGGAQVPGLGADAFTLSEEGAPVPFTMAQNRSPPPRVVLLLDVSTTVTDVFPRSELAAIGLEVARAALADPAALVRVGIVNLGVEWMGEWVGTEAEVQVQLDAMKVAMFFDSTLWKALSDLGSSGATAIAFLTDGNPEDDPLGAERRQRITDGAPVLALGVGPVVQANLDLMASLSGGRALVVADASSASAAAAEFVQRRAAQDYVLTYRAPRAGAATRHLAVGIDGNRVGAAAQYLAPAEADRVAVGFASLQLTIQIGTSVQTRRILAGFTGSGYRPQVTQAMLDEVMQTFFGRAVIAFEAAPPLPAVVFEEIVREKLALRPLWDAVRAGDLVGVERLVGAGLPTQPLPLHDVGMRTAREFEDGYATFPTGLHATMYTERITPGASFRRGLDVIASSRWASAGADPAVAWRKTLERTARLALLEASAYPVSTRSLLAGLPLRKVDSGLVSNQLGDLPAAVRDRWETLGTEIGQGSAMLLPQAGTPYACWAVHAATGTAIGLLPDGSGGADGECLEWNHPGDDLILWLAGKVTPVPVTGVGVWLELEKIKARLVRRATIVLATGQDPGDWGDIARDLACNKFWEMTFGFVVGGSQILQSIEAGEVFSQVMTLATSKKWDNPYSLCATPPSEPEPPPRWCL